MTTEFIDFFTKFLNKELNNSIEPMDIGIEGEWYVKKHIVEGFKNYSNTLYVSSLSIGKYMDSYFRSDTHSVFYDRIEIRFNELKYVRFLKKNIVEQTNKEPAGIFVNIKNILSKQYQIESLRRIHYRCDEKSHEFGQFNKEQVFIISDIMKQLLNDNKID